MQENLREGWGNLLREEGRISSWQLGALLGSFLIGTSTIMRPTTQAGRDTWLAYLFALIAGLAVAWLWFALTQRLEVPTIQGIFATLGHYMGAPLALLYLWYYLYLCALVLRKISELYVTAVMPETPILVFAGVIVLLAAISVWSGLEVIGRLAELFFPFIALAILISHVLILATPNLVHWEHLTPVLDRGITPVLRATLSILTFPFAETILFANVLPFTLNRTQSWRMVMSITIFVGLLLMLSATLDSAVLSIDTVRSSFTTLSMLREVNVGDFLTRVEVVGIFTWTLGGFLKLSLCYWVLSLGLAEFLGLPDYRSLVFPLGIIMVSLSILLFESFAAPWSRTTL
ncbi:MAG: GerAB/ArcD/ProY family transporter [bacterium]